MNITFAKSAHGVTHTANPQTENQVLGTGQHRELWRVSKHRDRKREFLSCFQSSRSAGACAIRCIADWFWSEMIAFQPTAATEAQPIRRSTGTTEKVSECTQHQYGMQTMAAQ